MNPEKEIIDEINNLQNIGDVENFLKNHKDIYIYKFTVDLENLKDVEWTDYKTIIRAEKIKKLSG